VALVLTFHNLRAYFARVSESVTDPLTGLPNQRFALPHAAREVALAARDGASLAIVVADLDGFKAINDTYGHRAGDLVLREVAHCLQSAIGPDDVCARYGGDEFLIVMSHCYAWEAERRGQQLKAAVAALRFNGKIGTDAAVALSVGIAVLPDDGESLEELLEAADARMYRNKFAPKLGLLRPRVGGSRKVPS
jgi:diguanylate cyclase (GGDEF)-like protein